MASTTDLVPIGGRPRRGLAAAMDRSRAFRAARRHTWLVRTLRIVLPLVSLALLAYFGLAMKLSMGIDGVSLPSMPTITPENLLKMENPRYEGFNKDGSRFVVTAKTAHQEVMSRSAPIKLAGITGEIVQQDKSTTHLKAAAGTFDSTTNVLDLNGGIDIVGDNGLQATLSTARVLTKESSVTSDNPVMVALPAGTIRANTLVLKQKQRHITFGSGVAARLNPQPSTAGAAPSPKQSGPDGIGRRDLPVDVTARELVVDDSAKTATFIGTVAAVQGASRLESEELEIAYAGATALPGARPTSAPAGTTAAPTAKVRTIASRRPVVLTQASDRVTADAAHFDVPTERARLQGHVTMTSGADRRATADAADLDQGAETVLLTGNVHLVQGQNEMRGGRLSVDRKAARSQLTNPSGRIWARFIQPNAQKKPRPKAAAPAPPTGPLNTLLGGGQFKANPDAPIVVDADRLDVDDNAHRATFRGKVEAAQEDFKVRTAELSAFYTGAAGIAAAASNTPNSRPQAQLTRIEARHGVVITGKNGQKATGDWANFDVKANTVVLGGDVVLTEGKQSARGSKLVINLTTGQYDLHGNPDQSVFTKSGGGRPSAVFYPDQWRARSKKAPGGGAPPQGPAAAPSSADKPFQFDR